MTFFTRITVLISCLFISTVYSQYTQNLITNQELIDNGEHRIAFQSLNKLDYKKLKLSDQAFYHYLFAQCLERNNEEDKAYNYYLKSKKLYNKADSIKRALEINLDIAYLFDAQENTPNNHNLHLKHVSEYLEYAKKHNDSLMLAKAYGHLALINLNQKEAHKSLAKFKKALEISIKINNKQLESGFYNNIAALYNKELKKPQLALIYLQKDLALIKDNGQIEDLCYNYVNQAAAYYYLGQHYKAIEYLKLADNLPIKNYKAKTSQYIYEFLYKNYDALGDYNNAYKYLLLNKNISDSINSTEQNIAINDIQTKYQTKEKELENTKLKNRIETDRILLYSSIGVLLAVAAIAFLIIKNARRKEKISRQEKQIEQQKLEKALKDYELNSIDMMLEGQEKERQRIANDLHDNLGSMLATLKLNFENLKLRKSELRDEENKLYERTDELIEEAYQKVRRLAHAKNAGVFATEGLIPAIKKLAEKISIPGKLQIQVVPFGFSDRLENALEIAIFRSIQELSTNIIKHSQATEATIHLTHHDDNINIIIEDNGVGFKSDDTQLADGMGLHTIRKKIEQLGGTFTIDSTPGKGTTIIIDIPV